MAHIIPVEEQAWYNKNGMRTYSGFSNGNLGNARNFMQLREDLHFMFDNRRIVFVPKAFSGVTCLVVHAMVYSKDLLAVYHNLQLQDCSGIRENIILLVLDGRCSQR